jgi:hypothetical protein
MPLPFSFRLVSLSLSLSLCAATISSVLSVPWSRFTFDEETTTCFSIDQLRELLHGDSTSEQEKKEIMWHGYWSNKHGWVLSRDGAEFTNHR